MITIFSKSKSDKIFLQRLKIKISSPSKRYIQSTISVLHTRFAAVMRIIFYRDVGEISYLSQSEALNLVMWRVRRNYTVVNVKTTKIPKRLVYVFFCHVALTATGSMTGSVQDLCTVLALTQLEIWQSDWRRAGIRSTNFHIVVKYATHEPSPCRRGRNWLQINVQENGSMKCH